MSRTLLAVTAGPAGLASAGLALPLVTLDSANGNYFLSTGREVLFVYNPDASAHTFTVSGTADDYGLISSIVAFSVVATTYAITQMFPVHGWEVGGQVNVDCNSSLLQAAVIRISLS